MLRDSENTEKGGKKLKELVGKHTFCEMLFSRYGMAVAYINSQKSG